MKSLSVILCEVSQKTLFRPLLVRELKNLKFLKDLGHSSLETVPKVWGQFLVFSNQHPNFFFFFYLLELRKLCQRIIAQYAFSQTLRETLASYQTPLGNRLLSPFLEDPESAVALHGKYSEERVFSSRWRYWQGYLSITYLYH